MDKMYCKNTTDQLEITVVDRFKLPVLKNH